MSESDAPDGGMMFKYYYVLDAPHLRVVRWRSTRCYDPAQCKYVRMQALQQVDKWEHNHLCNPRYVNAWRSILRLPAEVIGATILGDDAEAIALRQNSPFGFFLQRVNTKERESMTDEENQVRVYLIED